MATRSLGVLTYDLVAKIGGFTAGMSDAERAADKSAKQIKASLNSISASAVAVGTAAGELLADGIRAAADAFPELIDAAAQFQDIADKTGGSAEGFANFAVSAKVAGVGMDEIASASTRLSKALVGVDDESKAAGAGLSALGINIKDFKQLSADQQIKKVAESFNDFADGTEKAAVAQQIFGKSGAELLKFFKDYTDNGGDVNILTDEMIKKADDFADAQSRLRAQLSLTAAAIATEFIDPYNALVKVIKDAITEYYNLDTAAGKLGVQNGVKQFAEDTGRALAAAIDYVAQSVREFQVLVDFVTQSAQAVRQIGNLDFAGAAETGAAFRKKYGLDEFGRKVGDAGADAGKTYVQRFNEELSRVNADRNRALLNAVNYGTGGDARPKLKPTAPTGNGRKDNSAAQEAKAQLAADLSDIKAAQDAIINSYQNAGKILEAERSAGLKDEQEYYAEKKRLLVASNEAEQSGLEQQIARLQQENLTGKDAIDNNRKIAEAQAKLTKAREDAATSVQVLAIQEESAYKKIASALLAARQAAQDYYDTTNRGYERMLAGLGQGNKQRDFLAGIQQIEDRYQQQRQDLANRRSQAELQSGGLTDAQAKQYDDQLAIINEFQDKAVASYQSYYGKLDAAQTDWTVGATEALKNYADEAANTAKLTEDAFGNAFKGLEDVLVDFVTTGKGDFKSLVDSIIKDMARIAVKQAITGPLSNWMSDLFGGSSGAGASGGDALGALINLNGWASGGFTGAGNPDEPAGIVHKGEWVIPADQVKDIGLANLQRGNLGSGFTQNLTVNVLGTPKRDTAMQVAQEARRRQMTAAARGF